MKLIKPEAKLLLQQPGLEGVYKQIELAGRTCYKSTDKITEDSAKPFVDRMIKSKHLAMLEHGTVYLEFLYEQPIKVTHQDGTSIIYDDTEIYNNLVNKYTKNPYSRAIERYVGQGAYCVYITTNLRVLVENGWMDDLKYICEPTEYHEKRYTFRVITSIGVTREFNRHRVNSIAEQSTRYCNYSKDMFGNEVTICIPSWLNIPEGTVIKEKNSLKSDIQGLSSIPYSLEFLNDLGRTENLYLKLVTNGWKPQEAREILPLCTATEAVYTAFASDWQHFFDLRYFGKTGIPHPNMVELAGLMAKEASENGIWNELCTENVEMAN
jgi:thymidylate synthase (FAD)